MSDFLTTRTAVFSPCGSYRLRLDRDYCRPGPVAAFLMVNPSRAGHVLDDPTVVRIDGFAARMRFSRTIIANLFAFVATDIDGLRHADDPVGPDNDAHIESVLRAATVHIAAWGPLAKLPKRLRGRWREVAAIADRLGVQLQCFGTAADGQPRHPLMLSYTAPLIEWQRPS